MIRERLMHASLSLLTVLAVGCLLLVSPKAQANDYLEKHQHYSVMSMGQGVLRFTIPVWVYGRVNDYYLHCSDAASDLNDSYLWYSSSNNANRGESNVHRFVSVKGERYGKNDSDGSEGEGYIRVHEGSVVVLSTYDGTKRTVQSSDGWVKLSLKRKSDDDHKRITYIEFDWYPPAALDNQTYYTGLSVADYKKSSGNHYDTFWWRWAERFTGASMPQSPQLLQPYLYTSTGNGNTSVGYAAVQYVTYQEPISYTTTLDSKAVSTTQRSDVIIVPMKDTVQRFFAATFNVWTDKAAGASRTLQSNNVNIPAYHKIYDFKAQEIYDAKQSTTGSMQLQWTIHSPSAEDVLASDVFEVQRALKSDFSDASSLEVVNFSKDSSTYRIVDNNVLKALAEEGDSASANIVGGVLINTENMTIYDAAKNKLAVLEVTMQSHNRYAAGRTVYYRIRRASSSFWGWNHDFSQTTSVQALNYLAPLAAVQPNYTLDPDFENNRKVHFQVKIDNAEIPEETIPLSECTFSTRLVEAYNDSVPVMLWLQGPQNATYSCQLEVREAESSTTQVVPMNITYQTLSSKVYCGYVRGGSEVTIHLLSPIDKSVTITNVTGPIEANATVSLRTTKWSSEWECNGITYQQKTSGTEFDALTSRIRYNEDSIKNVAYQHLLQLAGRYTGKRCIWDQNARLYLRKVHVEAQDTLNLLIPQDSITRQSDGSWLAHYTDQASVSCSHYSYSVYIDQSASLRKVSHPSLLQPKQLTGPELYRVTSASIASFQATKGTDNTGVLLTWTPNAGSLDEYRLWRKDVGASKYNPLTTTDKASYRDTDTEPDKHYAYKVEAVYTCNGSTTVRADSTIGWRSPYGSIRGRIRYEDGTACAGIQVSLSGAGGLSKTAVTDNAGAYRFDSLPYAGGTNYSIVPTSQTAQFRYNNSTSPSATIGLSTTSPAVENVDFSNVSAVRLSGRALYENSTIPVRDARLLLNGREVQNTNGTVLTDVSGNFSISVPKDAAFTLQIQKDGHEFAEGGFVRIGGDSLITLDKALDGVRFWDQTKVRLMGRVAGGLVQASLPIGFGLSKNYLGDNIRLVLELEGDNTSSIVNIPSDPDKDTLEFQIENTAIHFQKKRITIDVDPQTGEYFADLFPVRYKVVQATAEGYATLFAQGKTSETLDLSEAATEDLSISHEGEIVFANAIYCVTYRSPIDITCTQMRYGMPQEFYGEEVMYRQNLWNEQVAVPLARKDSLTGKYTYLFGAPVFESMNYDFRISAHEDYFYNNNPNSTVHEQVPIRGGKLTVYNGLHDAIYTQVINTTLNANGETTITLPVDYVSFLKTDEQALRVLDLSVESDGAFITKQAFQAYITGNKSKGRDFMTSTHGTVQLLDILRDPPGSKSSAFVESGTTYKYNYTFDFTLQFGLNLTLGYGTSSNVVMGTYAGAGGGAYVGNIFDMSTVNKFDIPVKSSYYNKREGSYTFETTDRIETSSDSYYVGEDADVYIGLTQNVYYDITDAVKPIDSLTYVALEARDYNGSMNVVAEGLDNKGNRYYLVTGREIAMGPYLQSTFHYTHIYIRDVMLPNLSTQRDALLLLGDSAAIQAIANAQGKAVYWSKVQPSDSTFGTSGTYRQLIPVSKTDRVWPDEVDAYNRMIFNWTRLLLQNETEKVNALYSSQAESVGNWSVSYATTTTHTESYAFSNAYTSRVDYPGASVNFGQGVIKIFKNILSLPLKTLLLQKGSQLYGDDDNPLQPVGIINRLPGAEVKFDITPIFDINFGRDPKRTEGQSKKTGFTLQTGDYGYMDVSVFRVVSESTGFNKDQAETGEFVASSDNGYSTGDKLYGSYVYRLNGGASRCPWEKPDSTRFYKPVLPLSAGTQNLENQRIDINVHERSFVPHDQPAIFQLTISNEGDGNPNLLVPFVLKLKDNSNPLGAKVYIDGQPLSGQDRVINLSQGTLYNKTMEVYAGAEYDYENLVVQLNSQCDNRNVASATFSVHYTPVASPINISEPRDKWLLNTLSPKDSRGYYLPVTIDGFDVNYRGFDHIEFQYKLSTQSSDAWVNLCSYYADSALYNAASGNKAMITSGKIERIRFYGERDPMEQQYDLRAVSFSRVGNSFVTRSSAVLTGIKDTRPPRVFGEPEPANALLGVGDNLRIRFNEAIAGNYLDEDNNFQIKGATNSTGITTNASVHFDGSANSYAISKVDRSLANRSFSIDLVVKPTDTRKAGVFFSHSSDNASMEFGMTADNRLYVRVQPDTYEIFSKPLAPMTAFTRVVMTYDYEKKLMHFYAGTQDVTDSLNRMLDMFFSYTVSAPICFGKGFDGNILEARVWSKVLTPEEIAGTHMRHLTGYERELLAYYPMNEGRGTALSDNAGGATLTMEGATWTLPQGLSLRLTKEMRLKLIDQLLSRSSTQDATLMFWLRSTSDAGHIFSAGWTPAKDTIPAKGLLFALENGSLVLRSGSHLSTLHSQLSLLTWHHVVLTVNRSYGSAAVYLNGNLVATLDASAIEEIAGDMYLGGNGFAGNIDEFVLFEQAMSKAIVEQYDNITPTGDEMGLMAFLPFEAQQTNTSGIPERVFSINDQRQFRNTDGTILHKVVPLAQLDAATPTDSLTDKAIYAPVRSLTLLTPMRFDWAFNQDELLINLNMLDREINKQSIAITVRNVEDLNGNPMQSPVMWVAYVDRNSLKWGERSMQISAIYGQDNSGSNTYEMRIINNSGKRHQYTVESMPAWLSVNLPYGSLQPTEEKTLVFTYNVELPVGTYSDLVYLTDENGLSEPLQVELSVETYCPWEEVNSSAYTQSMSLRGQVMIYPETGSAYIDSDPNDVVAAFCDGQLVGKAGLSNLSNSSNSPQGASYVYLTIHGNDLMTGKLVTFKLWQASTGKVFNLRPNAQQRYQNNGIRGYAPDSPVQLSTYAGTTQQISLNAGWNWWSTYLRPQPDSLVTTVLAADQGWKAGDLLKTPSERQMAQFDGTTWKGTLSLINYHQMYMARPSEPLTLSVAGTTLPDSLRYVTLYYGWSSMAYLLDEPMSVQDALTDYLKNATVGDVIKSKTAVAVFSGNNRWEGSLQTLRPGQGYLFRRLAQNTIRMYYYPKTTSASAPRREPISPISPISPIGNNAATNMTMIASIVNCQLSNVNLYAYIGSDLVGYAEPIVVDGHTLYFFTISSDQEGAELRFTTEDGQLISPISPMGHMSPIRYKANAHHGTVEQPVVLMPLDDQHPQKVLEDGKLFILMPDGTKYSATGKRAE